MMQAAESVSAVCFATARELRSRRLSFRTLRPCEGTASVRFRPWRHADAVGIPIVVDRLSRLADAQGERFRPAPSLKDMVRDQVRFYPKG